jgi:hypothetical protein
MTPTEIDGYAIPDYAQAWLDRIIQEGGNRCGNCGQFRVLGVREISDCPVCGEDAYDIYETALHMEFLP